jgi:hypothetical protein
MRDPNTLDIFYSHLNPSSEVVTCYIWNEACSAPVEEVDRRAMDAMSSPLSKRFRPQGCAFRRSATGLGGSCRHHQKLGQAHQIVGGQRQSEGGTDLIARGDGWSIDRQLFGAVCRSCSGGRRWQNLHSPSALAECSNSYSTVTLLARWRGWSMLVPVVTAVHRRAAAPGHFRQSAPPLDRGSAAPLRLTPR